MFRNGKANSGKGRLRQQVGMHPKPRFGRGTSARFNQVEQPSEQADALITVLRCIEHRLSDNC